VAGKFKFWQPGEDYFRTRKMLWAKFVAPAISCAAVLFVLFKLMPASVVSTPCAIDIDEVFKNFVNVQIGAIAILISFSIAIMTILVTAENDNMKVLKAKDSTECKNLNGYPLNLFQVLLSNITYNVLIEVIYLVLLIAFIFVRLFVGETVIKVLISVSVFFVIHILLTLLESVGQMYLTFWKNHG
jgi:hypothetical protein